MATHALLSLDKGNRASSWVWEFDPTHTLHTICTHCMCTLSCSSTGVTSTNALTSYISSPISTACFIFICKTQSVFIWTALQSVDHTDIGHDQITTRHTEHLPVSLSGILMEFCWEFAGLKPSQKVFSQRSWKHNRGRVKFPSRAVSGVFKDKPHHLYSGGF